MNRCEACHGLLQKAEMKCFMCGTAVNLDKHKVTLPERFCSGLKFAVIFSGLLTIASIFTDFTPSFIKCSVATLILGLAKSSAEQMVEPR